MPVLRNSPVPFDIAFDLELPHGRCVGIHLPGELAEEAAAHARARLDAAEWAFAETLAPLRRHTWVGGRIALREALRRSAITSGAVLSKARGAPALPQGVAGSVSHKATLAAAIIARDEDATRGIDIEIVAPRSLESIAGIARHALTEEEQRDLAAMPEGLRGRELLVRFSAKEAIYKAIDPFLNRYVGFKEVTLVPLEGGATRIAGVFSPALRIDATWQLVEAGSVILTTARASRA